MTTTLNLRYTGLDKFNHSTFSTFGTPEQKPNERTLKRMYRKMKKFERCPIWISTDSGVSKITTRDLGDQNLIRGGLYEVKFELKVMEEKFVNAWLKNRPKLLQKPDHGKNLDPAFFDESDDESDSIPEDRPESKE